MKYVLRAWGQLKRGFEVLALGVKCVLRAWGELKRGFGKVGFEGRGGTLRCELFGMCCEGMGGVENGVRGVGTG